MSSTVEPSGQRGSPSSGSELPVEREDMFELLGNSRRRHVIEYLSEHREPTDLGSLARHVAARENDTNLEEVTTAERKRAYTSLQQTHLPRLDDVGVVDFDKDHGVVRPSEQLSEFSLHLDVVAEDDLPQSVVYLALSALSIVLLVAVVVGVPVLGDLSPYWYGGAVLVLFTAVATGQSVFALERGFSNG
jgi:predicted transcriptional regulator